ncbi:MAG: signal peptidase I, partial [Patescibacteria group bacterium]
MLKQATNFGVWVVSGALLFGALGIVLFATPLLGNRALIVRSGSMEPAISVGDVVVVRPGEYQAGDAIAYNVPGKENMVVTHRVQEVREGATGFEYVTKGDANPEADSWVVTGGDIIGEELFTVPWVGTLLAFAKSRIGFVSLVVIPALVVVLSEIRVIWREMRKKVPTFATLRPRAQGRGEATVGRPVLERGNPPLVSPLSRRETVDSSLDKGRQGGISLPKPVYMSTLSFVGNSPPQRRTFVDGVVRRSMSFALIVVAASVMTPATFALYADSGTSSNNVFTASDDFGVGPGDVVINEIMWMGTDEGPHDEWIELRNMTSDPIDLTGWTLLNAGGGGSSSDDITLSGTILGDGYWLLGNNNSASSAIVNTTTVDQVTTNVELSNGGEQLTLKDPGGFTIDASPVTSGSWPLGDNSSGQQSMSRNLTPGDGIVVSNWHTCTD